MALQTRYHVSTTCFNAPFQCFQYIQKSLRITMIPRTISQCDHFQQFYNRHDVKLHVPIIR